MLTMWPEFGRRWPPPPERVVSGPPSDVLEQFGLAADWSVEPLSGGHIHATSKLTNSAGRSLVAQSVNRSVFIDLEACERNLSAIDERMALLASRVTPQFVRTHGGRVHGIGDDGSAWRFSDYIAPGSRELSAGEVAVLFGRYSRALGDLSLRETIGGFHDLGLRRHQMDDATSNDRVGRLGDCCSVVREISAVFDRVVQALVEIGPMRLRPTHGDAKFANVIADPGVVIDLDTTMPATIIVDLGELLRSGAIVGREDEQDPSVVAVDQVAAAAIVAGFQAGLDGDLDSIERAAFAIAGPRMAIFNAVRMITDHLNGDVYYRTTRPGQNLDRARTQLRAAELLFGDR
jgi:Phosphotransferase enzyme family